MDDAVLGLEHLVDLPVDIRFVVSKPQQFGRAVGGAQPVAGYLVHTITIDPSGDVRFLTNRPCVRPDNGTPEGPPAAVHSEAAHHLAAERYGGHIRGVDCFLREEPACGFAYRVPPILGILLDKTGTGMVGGVPTEAIRDDPAFIAVENRLVSGGSQIVCQDVFHLKPVSVCSSDR